MRKEVAQVSAVNKNMRKWNSILVSPYPTGDFMEAMGYANVEKEVNKEIVGGKFDFYIPQTLFVKDKYPYVYEVANVHHTKLTDYHCLEARGEKIEDGFRMNIDCVRENLYKVKNAMREEGY